MNAPHSESLVYRFGPQSALLRWFNDYWSPLARFLIPWVMAALLIVFIFVGPQLLIYLLSFLPLDQLGTSGASHRNHLMYQIVAAVLGSGALAVALFYALKPRYIEISDQGVRLCWGVGFIRLRGALFKWAEIASVSLFEPLGVVDADLAELVFNQTAGSVTLKMKLKDLSDDACRIKLSQLLQSKFSIVTEPRVFDALAPKRSLSFTELWLDALTAPPKRERLIPLVPGSLLDGRYEVVSRLGAGSQGTVYLVKDTRNGEEVVIKETILPVYASAAEKKNALERFHKEALALEAVKHKNIVKFLSSFVSDNRAYLVLERLSGDTLKRIVEKQGPFTPAQTVELGLQICDLLSALHSAEPSVVHRDLTPDNLILDEDKRLVLIDFAVATTDATESDDVAGKTAYMAPEQFKGKATAASDLYSAGCTLSYLLTGVDPDPLTECCPITVNDSVPLRLSEVVGKATKYGAEDRYHGAEEFRAALEAAAPAKQ